MAIIESGNVAPFVRTGRNGLTLEITSHRLADGRLLVTYRDITELKTHEQELERSRSTLQTVLDEMPDALLVYDADGKWLFFNEATLKFLNLDRPTLQGLRDAWSILDYQIDRGDFGAMDAAQRAEFVATRKQIFASGTEGWMLLRRREHMLHFRMTVLGNGWRLGMFRDVTDLEGARQSAVDARQTLLLAMEAMDDGIAFLDRDERLVLSNEAYRRFMQGLPEIVTPGVVLRDAVHHAAKVLKPPKETPEVWAERQLATLRSGRPALIPYGPNKWARVSLDYASDSRAVVLVSDVSEERRRQRDLEQALVAAEKSRERGGGRQPGQVDLPRHHEPRDPHADERRSGHDGGAGGRGRARGPGAHRRDHARIGAGAAAHHRRRARLLQDRGRAGSSSRRRRSR